MGVGVGLPTEKKLKNLLKLLNKSQKPMQQCLYFPVRSVISTICCSSKFLQPVFTFFRVCFCRLWRLNSQNFLYDSVFHDWFFSQSDAEGFHFHRGGRKKEGEEESERRVKVFFLRKWKEGESAAQIPRRFHHLNNLFFLNICQPRWIKRKLKSSVILWCRKRCFVFISKFISSFSTKQVSKRLFFIISLCPELRFEP